MAERRMFAKTIIDSDAFIDMPATARLLYYDLAMRADDDGFVNSPRKIMAFVGAKNDDINILAARKFIIPFDNGVVVIKHWRIHNYIRSDTYRETTYKEQKAQLVLDENKAYTLAQNDIPSTSRRRAVNEPSTQDSIGEDSVVKDNNNIRTFVPPTLNELAAYVAERGNKINAEAFLAHYEANGWYVGNRKMKDWKAAVRYWEHNGYGNKGGGTVKQTAAHQYESRNEHGSNDIFTKL